MFSTEMKPLAGMRVLDLSRVLAGPLCTQTLADLGAEVIKIEPCGAGDESRGWPPLCGHTGTAFLAVNRNKKSVTLDLRTAEGLAVARDLAAVSDIVVESNSTGATDRLGLGYDVLKAAKPDLIYCSISGFGREGPLKDAKGYDLMLQAFSGILDLTGEPGGAPARSPFSPIDQATGHHAVVGILSAALRKAQTGQGAFLEVSLFETATHFVSYLLQAYWTSGALPQKLGCEHPALVPYQPFATADKAILIGVANDALWVRFCRAFGLDDLIEDPRYRTNAARCAHRAETVAAVQAVVAHWPSEGLLEKLIEIGVPCAPINTIADLANHDHTQARGIVVKYDHPTLGSLNAVAQPIQFDGRARDAGAPPPDLGQHNREILNLLGYDAGKIEALQGSGALGRVGVDV
jgi:crotonobetainyl-CoA:carnitine CoA-transferase CaiB-like acyl-CoA transferase